METDVLNVESNAANTEAQLATEEYNPEGCLYPAIVCLGIGLFSTALGAGLLVLIYSFVELLLCIISGQPVK